MKDFIYAAPISIDDAVKWLSKHRGRTAMLAGGTDILVQLREHQKTADLVLDVKKIPSLLEVSYSAETGLTLGAAAPCTALTSRVELAASYPALIDAARIIGGWQIQTRASIGGNLCNCSPAADGIGPLIVHQAVCHIAGPQGRRSAPVETFCTGPGKNILQGDEFLVCLTMPPPMLHSASAYERFIPRNEMDIAVAGAASWVQLDDSGQTILEGRVALAAVAPTPVVAAEAGEYLRGKPVSEETFAQAGELAKRVASPIDDMRGTAEYRTHLAGVLTRRTLTRAAERARKKSNNK